MIRVLAVLLGLGMALWGEPASIQATTQTIALEGGGGRYVFDKGGFHHLRQAFFQDRALPVEKLQLIYLTRDGVWHWEKSPHGLYQMAYSHAVERVEGGVRLTVRGQGERMTLLRQFTLRDGQPSLGVRVRLEVRGENQIVWAYLLHSSLPVESQLMRLVAQIEGGVPRVRLRHFADNPFVDGEGKPIKVGNSASVGWVSQPLVGVYSASSDSGYLMAIDAEKTRLLFRCGLSRKSGYWVVSPHHFARRGDVDYLDFSASLVPFAGHPRGISEQVVAPYVQQYQRCNLVAGYQETGACLMDTPEVSLWHELPDNKVYRDRLAPARRADGITLSVARGEGESFQVVLRSKVSRLSQVSLSASSLRSGEHVIPARQVAWSSIGYVRATIPWTGLAETLGEQPDTLLGEIPMTCEPFQTQPFWVTVSVPDSARPGLYRGQLEVRQGAETLARIPLTVRVWSFSVARQTLTAAFEPWENFKRYPRERHQHLREEMDRLLVAHRGGRRWVKKPLVTWDETGSVKTIDFGDFDASVERCLKVYRHNLFISSVYMLGWGHVARDTFFGKAEEILTPVWRKRLMSFSRLLAEHLRKKGWNELVVFDLFDEPLDTYDGMINETVRLLHEVEPGWRFTYAGNAKTSIASSIRFWNINCGYAHARDMEQLRKNGSEVSVYNPRHYEITAPLTFVRANYWWLWKTSVRYIYHWCVSYWSEHGYEACSDDYRSASWIVPGPQGPLPSLRLAMTREGIEDYEYLTLLRDALPGLKAGYPTLARKTEDLLKRTDEAVSIPGREDAIMAATQNPAVFAELHEAMGSLLEAIHQADPSLLPQADP